MVNDNKEKISLVRQMGVFDSTMMMVGIVIGSGIFLTTGIMAQSLPSAGLILLTWFFGGLIVLAGEQLFTFAMFINILFWTAAAASVFKLRKKYPELPRPYKTWGYPVTPLVFIIVLLIILVNTLIKKPVESLAGLGLAVIGIPIYYTWRKTKMNTG